MNLPDDYPRCKTCKHFEVSRFKNVLNGHCHRIVDTENYDNPGDRIFDGVYDHAVVGPDFGCVHWEAKDVSEMAVDAMSKAFDALLDPKPGASQER